MTTRHRTVNRTNDSPLWTRTAEHHQVQHKHIYPLSPPVPITPMNIYVKDCNHCLNNHHYDMKLVEHTGKQLHFNRRSPHLAKRTIELIYRRNRYKGTFFETSARISPEWDQSLTRRPQAFKLHPSPALAYHTQTYLSDRFQLVKNRIPDTKSQRS